MHSSLSLTLSLLQGKLGPRFTNGKSLFGSLGGFFICMCTTALYFARTLQFSSALAIVSIIGGLAGSRSVVSLSLSCVQALSLY